MGEGTGSERVADSPHTASPLDPSVDGLAELMRAPPVPATVPAAVADPDAPPSAAPKAAAAVPKPRASRRMRFVRDLGIGATMILLIHAFIVQVSVVRGLSMAPSLRDGDRLMVDRISYSMSEVERFDVVVLRYPKDPEVDFVKRIIGLPGDRVELQGGQLFVNGEMAPEFFGHVVDQYAVGSWVIPAHCFFVLGDNRPVSCDSREFGMVDRALLKGKVRVVFWPPSRFTLF